MSTPEEGISVVWGGEELGYAGELGGWVEMVCDVEEPATRVEGRGRWGWSESSQKWGWGPWNIVRVWGQRQEGWSPGATLRC